MGNFYIKNQRLRMSMVLIFKKALNEETEKWEQREHKPIGSKPGDQTRKTNMATS